MILMGLLPAVALAKRAAPLPVEPVVYEGVRYLAPNDDGQRAYIQAWDVQTRKQLWELTVFTNRIDPKLEEDVQWVFIKSLSISDGALAVISEDGKTNRVDLKTKAVSPDTASKIDFDLSQINADGLRGPAEGKVAVAYEFAIPNTDICKRQVQAIDPTIELMPGVRGRIGAGKQECLCIGSTHQKNFRQVLKALSDLSFVQRIVECHFE